LGTIVLAETRTDTERQAVADWAATHHPGAAVESLGQARIDDLPGDTVLVPARVVWLPPEREGQRRGRLVDVVLLSNPRRPPAFRQAAIRNRHPDRVAVVAGAPATIDEMREPYRERQADGESFPAFVGMRAHIAAERAERALVGDRYKVPRLVAEQISSSARFRNACAALAADLGRPAADVAAEATGKMSTFVATQSALMRDLFDSAFGRLYKRAWTVSVDLDTLGRLREQNASTSLIFLPSHRSYADPLVLSGVLHEYEFPPNLVLGGNNLAFWPVAPVAQRAGTIFIRRQFGSDPIYKLAMRSYLSFIVEKRFNLEWYIEGGRSRTGKLRPPKLGLLAYVAEAVEALDDADATIVPVSIVYDQLPEIAVMAQESAGGTKRPEDLKWLVKYARGQRVHRGEARVRFGEPFSLRTELQRSGDGRARLEKVAFKVMDEINTATPISATSLAGFALLGAADRAFTAAEIEAILAPLLRYIEERGLPGPDPSLCRGIGLLNTLGELTGAGVLDTFDGGPEQVWSVAPDNHAVAAYYRNGAVHHFVDRAIVELCMLAVAFGTVRPDAAERTRDPDALLHVSQDEALRIRDLLKFEFFFPAKQEFLHRLGAELDLMSQEWRTVEPTREWVYDTLFAHAGSLLARRTLQSFLDAQLVVARHLASLGSARVNKDTVLMDCLGLGRQLSLQGVILSKDSVSKDLYDGAYRLAENRHAAGDVDADELVRARRDWLAEVEELRGRLARIAEIEAERAASDARAAQNPASNGETGNDGETGSDETIAVTGDAEAQR